MKLANMTTCTLNHDSTPRVAYLGPPGSFTQIAAETLTRNFSGATIFSMGSPSEVIGTLHCGTAEYACLAFENSVEGAVTSTYDALTESGPVQIYGEADISIAFNIMTLPNQRTIRRLSAHPVAFRQIRSWVKQSLPEAEFVPASSNSAAAEAVMRGEMDAAAAPSRAEELFGLESIARDIADFPNAKTRFILVGLPGKPPARTGHDRTSVFFSLPNKPGSLVGALQDFSQRGVDLSRIESRPTRDVLGNYRFFVDLIGHIEDQAVAEALRALKMRAEDLLFLGSWPAATPAGRPPRNITAADDWVARARRGQ